MAYQAPKVQRVMVPPVNLIFRYLQSGTTVVIWIRDSPNKRFEGVISGFDEFMNVVLKTSYECNIRTGSRRKLGTILLRGEVIVLIHPKNPEKGKTELSNDDQSSMSTSGDQAMKTESSDQVMKIESGGQVVKTES